MKRKLTDICKYLGIIFKNDTGIEKVGIVDKINKDSVLIDTKNFISLDHEFHNCLVISKTFSDKSDYYHNIGNRSLIYYSQNPMQILYKVINELLVNSPIGVNEQNLKYYSNPNKQIFIKRLLGNYTPNEDNYAQRIGISGGCIFYSDSNNKEFNNIGWVEFSNNTILGNNITIYRGVFGATKIGNNVVIEDNAVIYPDVNIGDNSIITAGSIVKSDIPSDSIYNSFDYVEG